MKEIALKTIGAPLWAKIRNELAQINERIDDLESITFVVVDELPSASADTMDKIYFAPSEPGSDTYDEYVTKAEEEGGTTTYSWQKINVTGDVLVSITQEEFDEIFN